MKSTLEAEGRTWLAMLNYLRLEMRKAKVEQVVFFLDQAIEELADALRRADIAMGERVEAEEVGRAGGLRRLDG